MFNDHLIFCSITRERRMLGLPYGRSMRVIVVGAQMLRAKIVTVTYLDMGISGLLYYTSQILLQKQIESMLSIIGRQISISVNFCCIQYTIKEALIPKNKTKKHQLRFSHCVLYPNGHEVSQFLSVCHLIGEKGHSGFAT